METILINFGTGRSIVDFPKKYVDYCNQVFGKIPNKKFFYEHWMQNICRSRDFMPSSPEVLLHGSNCESSRVF